MESSGQGSTSSEKYTERNSLELTNVESGKYKISWYLEALFSTSTYHADVRIQLDNITLAEFTIATNEANKWYPICGFAFADLKGNHAIDIDYKSENSKGTVTLRNVRLDARRIGEVQIQDVLGQLNVAETYKLI